MKTIISDLVWADLEDIGDYIAQDSPLRARKFVSELLDHCERLADFPNAAPLREDVSPGIRAASHGQYLIFYRVADGALRIERILQGNRLFPEAD
ncbi:type II toxin-antitoxin system RelE/ParE family toxin [Maricaulis sp.]|uniref:type II toxin-antitoxin system RelE/ParE family toxin n=1 Tax=Maricaulis sp. TaxID=1486257 RepID=UPI003A91571C